MSKQELMNNNRNLKDISFESNSSIEDENNNDLKYSEENKNIIFIKINNYQNSPRTQENSI